MREEPLLKPEPPWNHDAAGLFVTSLEGVESTAQRVALADDIEIRKYSRLDGEVWDHVGLTRFVRGLGDTVLAVTVPAMRFNDAEDRALERFDQAITSLRLIGVKNACLGEGFAIQGADLKTARPLAYWPKRIAIPDLSTLLPSKLGRAKAERLRQFMRQLTVTSGDAVRIAMGRFNFAHARQTQEDRFIDVWIGLEALFSPTDKFEVRYRIALRAARLIGRTPQDRLEVYRLLLKSYDLRSKVVHGRHLTLRKPRGSNLTERDVLIRTEAVLRHALEAILDSRDTFDPVDLDEKIAKGD